jgi:5-methylcytosine-specific restriction endonuclease McrA
VTGATVVLTIAHLDHDPTHNDWSNLRAWCQRCHNTYDVEHRRQTRARTRRQSQEAAGQGRLDVQ